MTRMTAIAMALAAAAYSLAGTASEPLDDVRERYEQLAPLVGQACQADQECVAPLRCVDATCARPAAMVGLVTDTTPMVLFYGQSGEALYYLEVADDPDERERGLMYRPSMLDEWGMIFVYPDDQPLSFWMRNTYIPLDMVFVNGEGVVVGVVENAEPLTTTSRAVDGESRFVVELNAGQAARWGIEAGVRCELLNFEPDVLTGAEVR